MATTFKGLYKSLKYITQLFAVKEREMEIGYPTDVKHVAHVGYDGPSGNGPNWMDDFIRVPGFSTSIGSLGELEDSNPTAGNSLWSSLESEQLTNIYEGISSAARDPHTAEKPKRRKAKSTSSSRSSSGSLRRSRSSKSKATLSEREATPITLV